MAVRYVPNIRGIALLGRTPAMLAAMLARADGVAEHVRANAPVGEGNGGHYKDQIETGPSPITSLTAGARVSAKKFTSGWIEFGTEDTPAFAPLRNAADANGLELGGAVEEQG